MGLIMSKLIHFTINHFRMVLIFLMLILFSGGYIFATIPRESFPEIDIPYAIVVVPYQGVSPEDSEKLLLQPLENAIKTVNGIKEYFGFARDGVAEVQIEFDIDIDFEEALNDLKDEIDAIKADFPPDADEPVIKEITTNDIAPAVLISVGGNVSEMVLQRQAKKLQTVIESVTGILEADIIGEREEQIEIILKPSLLESYGLSLGAARALIESTNKIVTAGKQDTGQGSFALRAPGRFNGISEIRDAVILVDGDARVTLGDVADIRRSFKDPSSLAHINGKPALVLGVSKKTGVNETTVIDAVKTAVNKEIQSWDPELLKQLEVNYSQDASVWVQRMLDDLGNSVILSILLVMISVLLVLGLRAATLIVISIPTSFLLGMILINGQGFTLNMMVLFGLILSVGLLVDGAIIVIEYADRKMREGLPRKEAYAAASIRMFLPVLSSTATTLSAFVPLLLWPGIEGEFMRFLPLTLIAILSASLLVAIIIVPVLGSLFGKPNKKDNPGMAQFSKGSSMEQMLSAKGITGVYVRFLNRVLDFSGVFVFVMSLILISSIAAFIFYGRGSELFPSGDPDLATITVKSRGNLSLDEMQQIMTDIEKRLPAKDEYLAIYTKTERDANGGSTIGTISLEFEDYRKRRSSSVLMQEIKNNLNGYVGVDIIIEEAEQGPPVGKTLQLDIFAPKEQDRIDALLTVKNWLQQQPNVIDLDDNRPLQLIEYQATINRQQAMLYGVSMDDLSMAFNLITDGVQVSKWQPEDSDEEIELRVRFPSESRTLSQVENSKIVTALGVVPLSNFADIKFAYGKGVILHKNGEAFYQVAANLLDPSQAGKVAHDLKTYLESPDAGIPSNVRFEWGGEDDKQKETSIFLIQALVIAIFMIAIILVTQFNSIYATFLILTAILFSLTGVFLSMLIMDLRFSIMMTGVGIIALAGIVINNNIVLIDTFQIQRKENPDEDIRASILRTGGQRLRPVLLTTVTTVLGLMPMVLKISINFVEGEISYNSPTSQIWVQLSAAIAAGLVYSTILTLYSTPCLLYMGRVFTPKVKKKTLLALLAIIVAIVVLTNI